MTPRERLANAMTTQHPPTPAFSPEEIEVMLKRVIRNCARPRRDGRIGHARWSIVGMVTGHGAGHSADLCRWAGVDPDERCVRT